MSEYYSHPNAAMGAHVARANAVPREAVVTKVKVAVLMECKILIKSLSHIT